MASLSSLSFRTCAFIPGEGFDFAKKIVTVGINYFRTSNVMTHEDKQNVTTKYVTHGLTFIIRPLPVGSIPVSVTTFFL